MRLVVVDPHPVPSSHTESLQVLYTAAGLARYGEVHLIASKGMEGDVGGYYGVSLPQTLHIEFAPSLNIRRGPFRLSWNLPFFAASLLKIMAIGGVDGILVRNLKLANFLLHFERVLPPIVFEVHEVFALSYREEVKRKGLPDPGGKGKRIERMERRVYSRAKGLVYISRPLSEMVQEIYGIKGPSAIAHDGVDLEWFGMDRAPSRKGPERYILYLGSLHHWKGVDVLIRAMVHLRGRDVVCLIVGGEGEQIERYRSLAMELGVEGCVRFEGFVPPYRRFEYLRMADICVLPLRNQSIARYFTSPIKLFEYMASQRPVVASDLPTTREVITSGVNGLLVPPEDPEALAGAISLLLENPDLGRRLAGQAASDVRRYTWDERARRIVALMEGIRG